jgi:hypothetical protein
MPPGGTRTAKAGATYANRADLNGSADATYGDGVNAQTVRTATPNTTRTPSPSMGGQPMAPPGAIGPLDAPTDRPNEPLTAGLPIGAGPGPAGGSFGVDDALYDLRALAQRYPYRELLRLIALAEARR